MSANQNRTVRVKITGRVQGVGFRYWTLVTAKSVGLSGWVRNRADGSVEALLSGPTTAVDLMLAACEGGPAAARVENVVIEDPTAPPPDRPGFHKLPTL